MGAYNVKQFIQSNYNTPVDMILKPDCAELSFHSYNFNALNEENQEKVLSILSEEDRQKTEFYYVDLGVHGIRIKY